MRHRVIGWLSGRYRSENFGFRISDFGFSDIPQSSPPTAGERLPSRDGALPRPQAANSNLKTQNSKLNTDLPGWLFIPNSEFRIPNSYQFLRP